MTVKRKKYLYEDAFCYFFMVLQEDYNKKSFASNLSWSKSSIEQPDGEFFLFKDLTKFWYILSYVLLNAPIHSYQAIHMIRKKSSQGNDKRGQTLPCFSDVSWKKLSASVSISRRIPAVGYRSLESINKISR